MWQNIYNIYVYAVTYNEKSLMKIDSDLFKREIVIVHMKSLIETKIYIQVSRY